MQHSILESNPTQVQDRIASKPDFIYACLLNDGRYVVGKTRNAARKIASINSGLCEYVKGAFQINRIIAVKECTPDRTLPMVVANFCERFGSDKVIVA